MRSDWPSYDLSPCDHVPRCEDFLIHTLNTCETCYLIKVNIFKYIEERTAHDRSELKYWLQRYMEHDPETHLEVEYKKHHSGNGKPKGIFAGTLTVSPSDPYNEHDMTVAIEKVMNQGTCPVKRYAWYVEKTSNGLPHIHFIYETEQGGRIHAKVFMRYWKIWDEKTKCGKGHRGGYHKLVSSETAYTEYIAKDGGKCVNKWTTD